MTLPVALRKDLQKVDGSSYHFKTQKTSTPFESLQRFAEKKMTEKILNKARDDLTHATATQESNAANVPPLATTI